MTLALTPTGDTTMQTTTKRIFAVTSPTTGEVFTRQSARDYTHAVVYMETVERQKARAHRYAESNLRGAMRYAEIAGFLETNTTPDATHRFRMLPCDGWSVNTQRAGVKTIWDNVEYYIVDGAFGNQAGSGMMDTRQETAAKYRKWAEEHQEKAKYLMAKTFDIREYATFHHSAALAQKAANTDSGKYDKVTVVPCEVVERKPKRSKAAWNQ